MIDARKMRWKSLYVQSSTVLLLQLITGSLGQLLNESPLETPEQEKCSKLGWFGPHCVYKCHCNSSCDPSLGTCDSCEDGYAGTACQYANLAFRRTTILQSGCSSVQNSSDAVDGEEETCLTARRTDSGSCTLSVILTTATFVTQVIVKTPVGTADNNTVQVVFHNNETSMTIKAQSRGSGNNTEISFFPPDNILVTRVDVVSAWEKELKLCELNVLGGRNMALKKNASQSGETSGETYGAEKAVDDEGKRHYKDQCAIAKTKTGQPLTSWWRVDVGRNVFAWQVEIHTLPESVGFNVSMKLSNGSFALLNNEAPRTGIVITKTDRCVQTTEITINKSGDNLTLCEVRVLGDCLNGYFGWSCEHQCQCHDSTEVCDKVSGACSSSGCRRGWFGPGCQEACPPGYYGFQCHEKCSDNCADEKCLYTDGSCSCKPGWEGDRCSQRCQGSFGIDCKQSCPSHCLNITCHAETGDCTLGCMPGWTDGNCSKKCDQGFYGNECSSKCSSNCRDGVCDPGNGTCLKGCMSGTTGNSCEKQVHEEKEKRNFHDQYVTIVLSVGIGFVTVSIIIMTALVYKRRQKGRLQHRLLDSSDRSMSSRLYGAEVLDTTPLSVHMRVTPEQVDASSGINMKQEISKRCATSTNSPASKKKAKAAEEMKGKSIKLGSATKFNIASSCDRGSCGTSSLSSNYSEVGEKSLHRNAVPVVEFAAKVKHWLTEPRLFAEERSHLPDGKVAEWKTALIPENIRKSRYRDIYPYDHSRVMLNQLSGSPHSDFYNASYIDGYNTQHQYIAAQGPMEKTTDDFLRMVWDVKCSCIVMLTNTVEMGRVKCHQYWPADGASMSTENVTLSLLSTTTFADFCVRDLILERNGETRRVKMFHYTAWPDNSAPVSPWSILSFRNKVHQEVTPDGPVVVHCSAGIGRTGTFLAIDILLSRAAQDQMVDVFACVWTLRQQRISMVQTLTQYTFIYEAIAAALVTSAPEPVDEFRLSRWLGEEDGSSHICNEYQKLKKFLKVAGKECNATDNSDESKAKSSLYATSDRDGAQCVSVFDVEKSLASVSVDAVFLSVTDESDYDHVISNLKDDHSYRYNRAFIQTHSPRDCDIVHFLSMVCQHHVTTIVSLDTMAETSQDSVYWPEVEQSSVTFGPYRVELLGVRTAEGITTRFMRIHLPQLYDFITGENSQGEAKAWHDVTQLTSCLWPDSLLTSEAVSSLQLLVNAAQPEPENLVLVHCKDGRSRSGLFCVLSVVRERMRSNSDVAISYVTAHLSAPEGCIVITQDQYKFLFYFVQHQIDAMRGEDLSSESQSESGDTTLADIWTI